MRVTPDAHLPRQRATTGACSNAPAIYAKAHGRPAARQLRRLLRGIDAGLRLSEHMDGDGPVMFRHACAMGLAGIVSKRRDTPYRSGRSPHWIKVKNPNAPAATRVME
jgi:hypothetical protein